ncbi:MAG: hypothetical protein AB2L07_05535 [Thermoanaerobaculaceae bacterium]
MRRTGSVLMPAMVGVLLAGQALAEEGRWTLRLQAGGMHAGGESISTFNGLAPAECGQVPAEGRCWVTTRYLLEGDHPFAGVALAHGLTSQWEIEAVLWRGSTRLRAERQGWPCSGVDCRDHYQIARDDVALTGADLGAVFHLPGRGRVDVYGGLLVGWVWAADAHLYGSDQGTFDRPREVRGGLEVGALAGVDVALHGAWSAGLQVRHTWAELEVEEVDPLHGEWAEIDGRLTAVQLTLGYTF